MAREGDEREKRERMAIEPTIPATDVRTGVPDFSSERPAADAGPGRAMLGVGVAVVVVVGALFFWLGGNKPVATAAPPPAPVTTPASKPSVKTSAKPTTAPVAAPPAAAPATPTATAAAAATPSPSSASHAHKRHKKPPARVAKHKEVKLPHLPSPPPADP